MVAASPSSAYFFESLVCNSRPFAACTTQPVMVWWLALTATTTTTATAAPMPTAAPTTSPGDGPMCPEQSAGEVAPEHRRTVRTPKAARPNRGREVGIRTGEQEILRSLRCNGVLLEIRANPAKWASKEDGRG